MAKSEFLEQVCKILDVPAGSLTGREKFADMAEWDSMAMMSCIAFADEEFDKILSPRQFANCETFDDLGRLLGVQ